MRILIAIALLFPTLLFAKIETIKISNIEFAYRLPQKVSSDSYIALSYPTNIHNSLGINLQLDIIRKLDFSEKPRARFNLLVVNALHRFGRLSLPKDFLASLHQEYS